MNVYKVGWGSKAVYGLGSIAYGVKDNGFSSFMMVYFNQVLGLPAHCVGMALLIAMVFDAVTDPYIGHKSDRWKSRLGRRHPFMYFAIVPAVLCYYSLWNPPTGFGSNALFAYLVVMTILVRLTISVFEVPNSALIAEMDQTYDGRTSLAGLRALIGWFGGILMAIIAYQFYLQPVGGLPGILNKQGYESFALLAASAMLISMLISSIGTHHLIPMFPNTNEASVGYGFSFKQSIQQIFAEPSFKALFFASLFSSMVFGISITLQVYFGTFYFGLTAPQLSIVAVSVLPSALIAAPLVSFLSREQEKQNVAINLTVLSIIFSSLAIGLKYVGLFPDGTNPLALILLALSTFVSVTFVIALQIIFLSMTADLVEKNQRETGHRAEGLYLATFSFTKKVVTGLGMFCSGILLSIAGGTVMSEEAMRQIAVPYIVIIAAFYLLSILFLKRFKLTRAQHTENLDAVNS